MFIPYSTVRLEYIYTASPSNQKYECLVVFVEIVEWKLMLPMVIMDNWWDNKVMTAVGLAAGVGVCVCV